jgi:hypothetical protein
MRRQCVMLVYLGGHLRRRRASWVRKMAPSAPDVDQAFTHRKVPLVPPASATREKTRSGPARCRPG